MESEDDKLRADLKRYRDLRARLTKKRTQAALEQLIEEAEERLRQLRMVANDR